jgi:type IV fimbrial biogenesis protein FimT
MSNKNGLRNRRLLSGRAAIRFPEGIRGKRANAGGAARGFTLVELMITISIIGILAVLSLPAYSKFTQNWKLGGEADQFAGVLRAARSAAVMKNIDVVFTFDRNNGTYSYFEDKDRDGIRDAGEYRSAVYHFTSGIVISAYTLPAQTLIFGSMGNTRDSGSITLRNTNDRTRTIRVYGGTGNVTVE